MRKRYAIVIGFLLTLTIQSPLGYTGTMEKPLPDHQKTVERLREHVRVLTKRIGDRSVYHPENLEKTADYIESFYREIGVSVKREPYGFNQTTVCNITAQVAAPAPKTHYVLGAHYDTVVGTVGADDNASAIAVQLETARHLAHVMAEEPPDISVKFVSFTLEEPPVFGTREMGSRVYALKARKEKEAIDGMICLEMVGYTCHTPGCQSYPFPLMFFGYPKQGDFIGIVGNLGSWGLTRSLSRTFSKNPNLPVVKLTIPFGGWLLPAVRLSDHASFWDQGFKAVMITDSAFYRNPHYHLLSDTMDKLDFNFMCELVKSLLLFFRSHGQQ
jgi:Peptidase family M28